jgi:hypothetical protein
MRKCARLAKPNSQKYETSCTIENLKFHTRSVLRLRATDSESPVVHQRSIHCFLLSSFLSSHQDGGFVISEWLLVGINLSIHAYLL